MEPYYNEDLGTIKKITLLGEVKKQTCLASYLCGKKEGGGPFFLLQNGRRTHFPKQPAGLFFQDGRQFFFLMGPTWTRDMTSVYLGLDSISSEKYQNFWKKIVFFFVF